MEQGARNILHIDSSIRGEESVSRKLSATIVAQLSKAGNAEVTYRDLVREPLPHITLDVIGMLATSELPVERGRRHQADISQVILSEFLEADIVVLGMPTYNFGIPSQLKAWLDRIAIAGVTFGYTEKGPFGLAGDKRVIVASVAGSPSLPIVHEESQLTQFFGLLGVQEIDFIRADSVSISEEFRDRAMNAAFAAIDML